MCVLVYIILCTVMAVIVCYRFMFAVRMIYSHENARARAYVRECVRVRAMAIARWSRARERECAEKGVCRGGG